ncbi:hypothetical protein F5Y14DRAFT_457894 [Nemania sp. NC0429]|nr:hypothetical protein F5Y14DRAFT_457894 [Nemania sp. NC0429]
MADSPENTGSDPSPVNNGPSSLKAQKRLKIHRWRSFELDTVCSLICKHEHRGGSKWELKLRSSPENGSGSKTSEDDAAEEWALQFTTKLNVALNGPRHYKKDIPVADVCELVDFLETEKKAVMAYIKRQAMPFRITRSKKYVFQRLFSDFHHTFYAWAKARREGYRGLDTTTSGEEVSEVSQNNGGLSSQYQGNYPLGTAQIQRSSETVANAERAWGADSAFAQRGYEFSNANRTSASAATQGLSSQPVGHASHHQNQYMDTTAPIPRPVSSALSQHETYNDMLGSDVPSTPSHPPPSPAYFGNESLRQSIHPMGPDPDAPTMTTAASPAYQYNLDGQAETFPTFQSPGHSTGQAHVVVDDNAQISSYEGYNQNPEPQQQQHQRREPFSYGGIPETPASPLSPMRAYTTLYEMTAEAEAQPQPEPQEGATAPEPEPEPVEEPVATPYPDDAFPASSGLDLDFEFDFGYGYNYGYGYGYGNGESSRDT